MRWMMRVIYLLWVLQPSGAQAIDLPGFTFHGFSFVTLTKENGTASKGVERGHTWLIFGVPLDSAITLTAIVAPEGPPRLLQNLHVVWQRPVWGITTLTIGKFATPFAEEFWTVRIDQTETVAYSRVLDASRFVARDTGIQTSGVLDGLKWDAAVFAGDRTGSDIPASKRGDPDGYIRLRLPIKGRSQIGFSQRFGPTPATAIDGAWQWRAFAVSGEGVRMHANLDYYILALVRLPARVTFLYRYEDFNGQAYHTAGGSLRLNQNFWIKANVIQGPRPLTAVGQLVIQW